MLSNCFLGSLSTSETIDRDRATGGLILIHFDLGVSEGLSPAGSMQRHDAGCRLFVRIYARCGLPSGY